MKRLAGEALRRREHEALNKTVRTEYSIEEWGEAHPRRRESVVCLEAAAPEQAPFVFEGYYRAYPSYLLVALQSGRAVGFIRFAAQPIGPEAKCPR